jgi:hypothetical protein
MTNNKDQEGAVPAGDGEPGSPNETLAKLVADDLVAAGLIRPADRARVQEGLIAGKVDGSTWRLVFENQLETTEASDAAR